MQEKNILKCKEKMVGLSALLSDHEFKYFHVTPEVVFTLSCNLRRLC